MAKKLVYGVGVYDAGKYACWEDGRPTKEYGLWSNMIGRCYSERLQKIKPTYIGCTVSDEFKNFQKFMVWAEDQVGFGLDGFHLDKDLLVDGNKVYSAETCVFVPRAVNLLLTSSGAKRGVCPVGVYRPRRSKAYQAQCRNGLKRATYIGTYPTEELAFAAYKTTKEDFIKQLANEFRDQIDPRAYEALMAYEVNITD